MRIAALATATFGALSAFPAGLIGAVATNSAGAAVVPSKALKVAVVMVNFKKGNEPFTKQQVEANLMTSATSANEQFRQSTDGAITLDGKVFGWITAAPSKGGGGCSISTNTALSAVAAAGIDLAAYDAATMVFPPMNGCDAVWNGMVWGGSGFPLNATVSYNRIDTNALFGSIARSTFPHSLVSRCYTAEGVPMTLSRNCPGTSGQIIDPISARPSPYNTATTKARLMTSQQVEILTSKYGVALPFQKQTVSASGTYKLARRHSAGGAQVLDIPIRDGNTQKAQNLSLELRSSFGTFDDFAASDPTVNGVLVRVVDPANLLSGGLLDATPQTATGDTNLGMPPGFLDAAFVAGSELADPVTGTRVRIVSVNATEATVDVIFPGAEVQKPSTVSNITVSNLRMTGATLCWNAATDNLGVAGYIVGRNPYAPYSVFAPTQNLAVGADWRVVRGNCFDTRNTKLYDDLLPGKSYTYTVSAVDHGGNVGDGVSVTFTTLPDTVAPGPFDWVAVSAADPGRVHMQWRGVQDNLLMWKSQVVVETRTVDALGAVGPWVTAMTMAYAENSNVCPDSDAGHAYGGPYGGCDMGGGVLPGLTAGQTYDIRLHAIDQGGNAQALANWTAPIRIKTPLTYSPYPAPSGSTLNLNWNPIEIRKGSSPTPIQTGSYKVERISGSTSSTITVAGTSYTDAAFQPSGYSVYTIKPVTTQQLYWLDAWSTGSALRAYTPNTQYSWGWPDPTWHYDVLQSRTY